MGTQYRLDAGDLIIAGFWTDANRGTLPTFEAFTGLNTPKKGVVPAPPSNTDIRVLTTAGWGFAAVADTILSFNYAKIPTLLPVGSAFGIATLDSAGKLNSNQIPDKAIEVTVTVADQAARLALTSAQVQNGDRVKQTDTDEYFELQNDAAINNLASWLKVSATAWSEVTNKPTTLSGFGITDGALNTRTVTGGGLATGGGDLTANRVITVTAASAAEAYAGSTGTKVVTPDVLPIRQLGNSALMIGQMDGTPLGDGAIDIQATRNGADGAIGDWAINLGSLGEAAGENAINIGILGHAIGGNSCNFGYSGNANASSVNVGYAGNAAGSSSVNVGAGGEAGPASVNVGYQGDASGEYSCNFGYGSVVGNFGVNVGAGGTAGSAAVNVGRGGAAAVLAVNVGNGGLASQQFATSIGATTQATAEGATAVGAFSYASGNQSASFGYGASATSGRTTTLGAFTVNNTPDCSQLAATNSFGYTAAVRCYADGGTVAFTLPTADSGAFTYPTISDCPEGSLGPKMGRFKITTAGDLVFEVNIGGIIKSLTLGTPT